MGRIVARLLPDGREVEVEAEKPLKVSELLKRVGMTSESAVVIRDGSPLLETDYVSPGEKVDIVRVLSGGG